MPTTATAPRVEEVRATHPQPRFNTGKKKMMQYNGLWIQESAYGTTSMLLLG